MQFTQLYRHSACVDLIPHGRTQFIVDVDHECRAERQNKTFEMTCEEFQELPPIEILNFGHCWSASPSVVFTEECSSVCKHGRPVSRCVYTVDPDGDYELEDSLDGCYVTGICMCKTADMSQCDLEARFVECYRTDEAVERLEAEAELVALSKSLGKNATISQKFEMLAEKYDQRGEQINDLEEENEEVSDQLEDALAKIQSERDKHKAELKAARSRFSETPEAKNGEIIAADRLHEVNVRLAEEIKARKSKEAELKQAEKTTSRLYLALAMASVIVVGALGLAYYHVKRNPRVFFVSTNTSYDGAEVENSTVVMAER